MRYICAMGFAQFKERLSSLVAADTDPYARRRTVEPEDEEAPSVSHATTAVASPVPTDLGSRPDDRPIGKPAFAESLFVELVRGHQWRRAYDQLAPDCQEAWGSVEGFAVRYRHTGLSRISDVTIRATRILNNWTDDDSGLTYPLAAELHVRYSVLRGDATTIDVDQTIHVVAVARQWRTLCYPPR